MSILEGGREFHVELEAHEIDWGLILEHHPAGMMGHFDVVRDDG